MTLVLHGLCIILAYSSDTHESQDDQRLPLPLRLKFGNELIRRRLAISSLPMSYTGIIDRAFKEFKPACPCILYVYLSNSSRAQDTQYYNIQCLCRTAEMPLPAATSAQGNGMM